MKKTVKTFVAAITLMVIAVLIASIFIPGCSQTNDKLDERLDDNVSGMVLTPCRSEPPASNSIFE